MCYELLQYVCKLKPLPTFFNQLINDITQIGDGFFVYKTKAQTFCQ